MTELDQMIFERIASLRTVNSTDAEVDEVLARASRPPRRLRSAAVIGSVLLLLGGLGLATPVTSAVRDLAAEFSGYFDGDDDSLPGAPLSEASQADAEQLPPWLTDDRATDQRVLASAGGHRLYVSKDDEGRVLFGLDNAVGIGESTDAWVRRFSGQSLIILGPVPEQDGVIALFGLSTDDVSGLRIDYADGPSTTATPSDGGFIALLDARRTAVAILALDTSNRVIQRIDLRYLS